VLFYLDEKEKDVNYLLKMAKKIERSARNSKVSKILTRERLLHKVQSQQHSIAIFSNDTK
jgi:hypothetical protein